MRRFFIMFITSTLCFTAFGQSKDFNNVFDACRMAQSSMADGEGSKSEIREASRLLSSVIWRPLTLEPLNTEGEADIKGHLVFTPEFFEAVSNGKRKVYDMAKKYAREHEKDKMRGDDKVLMCTKCIGAKQTVTYRMKHYHPQVRVAAVAEVNGMVNIKVWVKDTAGNLYEKKSTTDEYKGMPYRKLDELTIPRDCNDIVYITVENKYDEPRSVAIIVDNKTVEQ